jgi:hypothetical protein
MAAEITMRAATRSLNHLFIVRMNEHC